MTNRCTRDNINRVRPRIVSLPYRTLALPFTIYRQVIPFDGFFFLFFFYPRLEQPRIQYIPSLPPLYIYSMNNSCNTPRSIPPLDIAWGTGKRCRGILYKYLPERERDSFLTVCLSFGEGGGSNRSKKPRRKESSSPRRFEIHR